MRILNIILGDKKGSIGRNFIDYCKFLASSGHEVYAVLYKDDKIINKLPNYIKIIKIVNFGRWDPIIGWKTKNVINEVSPDLILSHGDLAIRLTNDSILDIPLVSVVTNASSLSYIKNPSYNIASNYYLKELLDKNNIGQKNYIVPNAIAIGEDATYKERVWHNKIINIGTIGKLVKKNGFSTFIKSLPILRARNVKFKASIAGVGPELDNLSEQASKLWLEDILTFEGWVSDRNEYLNSLDIFCLPTLRKYSCYTLLEAYSASLPVIASNIDCYKGIARHNENAILVPAGEPDAFAFAIERLINDHKQALKISEAGFKTVSEEFSTRVVERKLSTVINDIIANISKIKLSSNSSLSSNS